MKFRWSIAPPQPLLAGELAKSLKLSPLLAQCLLNRGLSDPTLIDHFLEPRLNHLADPFLLPNMRAAVERLFVAHRLNELVVIFGDYDVDGVTSTALLLEVLRALGWKVDYYLPHRIDEGYGLSAYAVENCLKRIPATLLVAVDCGSTSTATVERLRELGVDVIVLDHHQVSVPPPAAVALVNPQLAVQPTASSAEPQSETCTQNGKDFRELCSVGLALKLAH